MTGAVWLIVQRLWGIGCGAERGGMSLFQKGLGFSTEQEIFVENWPSDFSGRGEELNVSAVFASYRAAGTNAGNEPERNGPVELSETRKLDGTH